MGRSAVRGVFNFDIDAHGQLGFVRSEQGALALVIVRPSGEITSEVELTERFAGGTAPLVAWLREDTWIVGRQFPEDPALTLWAVDLGSRSVSEWARFDNAYPTAIRNRAGNGLFALLVHQTVFPALHYLGSGGKEDASIVEGYANGQVLFSPRDVTALPGGGAALAVNARNTMAFFDASGEYVESLDLVAATGNEPDYLIAIAAAPDGALALLDSGAAKPLLLFGPERNFKGAYIPRYTNGERTSGLGALRYGPDGSLWASDGEALLRLGEAGIVERVIGREPSQARLTKVAAAAKDVAGNFYLADNRTGSVHVFDASGRLSRRAIPASGDLTGSPGRTGLTVAGDGTIYLRASSKRYLLFDTSGQTRSLRMGVRWKRWYAHPTGIDLWVTTLDDGLYLADAEAGRIRRIRRHGDGTWLGGIQKAAVAADGSVALVTWGPAMRLGIFSSEGDSLLTMDLTGLEPHPLVAFDGRRVALALDKEVLFLDAKGEPLGKFEPGHGYDGYRWYHFLTPDDDELHLLDPASRTVYRFDISGLP